MAPNQEERIKQLVQKREGFTRELEALRAALNNCEERTPTTAIQRNLDNLVVESTGV